MNSNQDKQEAQLMLTNTCDAISCRFCHILFRKCRDLEIPIRVTQSHRNW